VTKNLEQRRPVLVPDMAAIICEAIVFYARAGKLVPGAFVVMPDHWHLLVHTGNGRDITQVMRTLDHWISRQTKGELVCRGTGWQEGFHETLVKSSKQFDFVRRYVEENPVRRELVPRPEEWVWSTASRRYAAYRQVVPCGIAGW